MQTLVLDDGHFRSVAAPKTKGTIHVGRHGLNLGPVALRAEAATDDVKVVTLISVKEIKAIDVTVPELYANGFVDLLHMISRLKAFYPNFSEESDVTILEWA